MKKVAKKAVKKQRTVKRTKKAAKVVKKKKLPKPELVEQINLMYSRYNDFECIKFKSEGNARGAFNLILCRNGIEDLFKAKKLLQGIEAGDVFQLFLYDRRIPGSKPIDLCTNALLQVGKKKGEDQDTSRWLVKWGASIDQQTEFRREELSEALRKQYPAPGKKTRLWAKISLLQQKDEVNK